MSGITAIWLLNFLGHFWVHHAWLPVWLLKIFSRLIHRQVHISYCFFFIWEFKILFFLVLNQYSKQLVIFVESKKKFLIWEFSSDLYHIYTIDFNCFDVRNGQWFYNSMRPKRCLVDLLLENVWHKGMRWTQKWYFAV